MMTLSLNSAKSLLNLCKHFKISSLFVGATPPKGEFNIGIVGKVFGGCVASRFLMLGLLGPASVDNGRETATQLKPLFNLSSPTFLSLVGENGKNII
jgi:hypothetical protein